jgi:hypothetical protein
MLMSKNKTTLAPAVTPAKKQIIITLADDSDAAWIEAYNDFCAQTGRQLSISPVYQLRDDGTFSTVIRTGVIKR